MSDYIIIKGEAEDRYLFLHQVTFLEVAHVEGGERVTVFFAGGSPLELTPAESAQFMEQLREKIGHRAPP
jgi:hypothetical protein